MCEGKKFELLDILWQFGFNKDGQSDAIWETYQSKSKSPSHQLVLSSALPVMAQNFHSIPNAKFPQEIRVWEITKGYNWQNMSQC